MNSYYGWGLPVNISTHGSAIDRLIIVLHVLMISLFIGWLIFLIYSLIRFRSRPGHHADYKPNHFKAPTYIEVSLALFELVLLIGFSYPVLKQLRIQKPDVSKSLQVNITAEQFAWIIQYPGADGVFGKRSVKLISPTNPIGLDRTEETGKDDIVSINQFNIPVHKPVIVNLTSKDVIHSFSIPVMRIKQDAIPGHTIPLWFEATQTGKFEIACAQLCGLGHYRMRGFFNVMTDEEFSKWLASKAPKSPMPAPASIPTTASSAPSTQPLSTPTAAAGLS